MWVFFKNKKFGEKLLFQANPCTQHFRKTLCTAKCQSALTNLKKSYLIPITCHGMPRGYDATQCKLHCVMPKQFFVG